MSDAKPTRRSRLGRGCGLLSMGAALGCFGALLGGFLLLVALGMFAARLGEGEVKIAKGSVLELHLSGALPEAPPTVDIGELFGTPVSSMWDLRRALQSAIGDARIAAVHLTIDNTAFGWPNAEEILELLDRVRTAGKPVVAHLDGDLISDLDYFLATAGDQIVMTPQGASTVNGVVAQAMHLRAALEKLDVEPKVIQYKEYKSAGEMFNNYEMSPYAREELEAVLDTISSRFEERVDDRRGIGAPQLEEVLAQGMAPASSLVAAGLVDSVGYRDQVEEQLVARANLDSYHAVSMRDYVRTIKAEQTAARLFSGDRIAVVFGEGEIVATEVDGDPFGFLGTVGFSGPRVARNIRAAVADPKVRAIVFRVNSPGGSAVGSDFVKREIELAHEAGKPVVVSMSDVAGSGGYWVAMAADQIVAHDTTITASIGVVFSNLNLDGLFEKLGINFGTVETAPNADVLGTGDWDERDRQAVMSWMDEAYGNFKQSVAEHRKLGPDRVEEIARGRIWSGRDAQERGLVDRIGGLDEALRAARELGAVSESVPAVAYPTPKPFWQALMAGEITTGSLETWIGSKIRDDVLRSLAAEAQPRVRAQMPPVEVR